MVFKILLKKGYFQATFDIVTTIKSITKCFDWLIRVFPPAAGKNIDQISSRERWKRQHFTIALV